MTITVGRPALMVVDVQNDFVHPGSTVGHDDDDTGPLLAAVDAINRLITSARRSAVPIVYVRVTHSATLDNAAYRARYAVRGMTADDLLCADGSWGAELYAGLAPPQANELVVTKHAYDAFAVHELPGHLERLGVDTVIVTGVVTELCVMGTVAGAFEHGYHVIVPRETTASENAAAAEAALALIGSFYGTLVGMDDLISALESREREGAAAGSPGA
jgi:ureidoacrylate peracid hydrolase